MTRSTAPGIRSGAATGVLLGLTLVGTLALPGCAVMGRGGRDPASPVSAPEPAAAAAGDEQAKLEQAERKRQAREAKRAAAEEKRAAKEAKRAAEREARAARDPALATAGKPADPREAKRAAAEEKRAAKEAKRAASQEKRAPLDPLGEARLKASEQPGEPWWPYRAALLEAEAGRVAASEASLRAALTRDPAYAPALARLSRLLYEQGRHAEAVELLAPVRRDPGSLGADERAAVLAGLALHEAALGRDVDARGTIGAVEGGEREGALGVAAFLAARSAAVDSALRLTKAAVRAAPESAAQQNNLGIALLRSGDADAAQKAFERAIALDPARPGPYYNLAILERFYRLDTGAAARWFQAYWARSHADPDSLYAELGHARPTPVAEGNDAK